MDNKNKIKALSLVDPGNPGKPENPEKQSYKLLFPFTHEGEKFDFVTKTRRIKVNDRIKAAATARKLYGNTDDPDAVFVCIMSRLCTFCGKRLDPEAIGDNLDYEDFWAIFKLVSESDDFLQ